MKGRQEGDGSTLPLKVKAMARKKAAANVAIFVSYQKADSLGTHSVSLAPCERAQADDRRNGEDREYPRMPEDVAGFFTGNGSLCWTLYRHNRREDVRGVPVALSFNCTVPSYRKQFIVDLADAERMVKTLKRIGANMSAQSEKYGWTSDFAEYGMRIAATFGAQSFAVERALYIEAHEPSQTWKESTAGERWVWLSLEEARVFLQDLRDIDLSKTAEEAVIGAFGERA